jgi:hypothetical protein
MSKMMMLVRERRASETSEDLQGWSLGGHLIVASAELLLGSRVHRSGASKVTKLWRHGLQAVLFPRGNKLPDRSG